VRSRSLSRKEFHPNAEADALCRARLDALPFAAQGFGRLDQENRPIGHVEGPSLQNKVMLVKYFT
jgi:hypothetical protein